MILNKTLNKTRTLNNAVAKVAVALLISSGLTVGAVADESEDKAKHSTGLSINSFGLGAFYTYKFNEQWHLRGSFHGSSGEDVHSDIAGIDYKGDAESSAAGIMLDWYPLSKGWKKNVFLSGGVFHADFDLDSSAQAGLGETITVGGKQVSHGDIESLNVKIKGEEVTPYLGIGWGNKISGERGFAFVGELGLMYFGEPDVTLTANDPNNFLSQADLNAERQEILDESDSLSAFMSLGVSYHF